MSGGEKNKFKIAQAFSKNINILFADEPTSNLDISSVEKFQHMLKSLIEIYTKMILKKC